MEPELRGEPFTRSPNLYGNPATVLSVYGYDAEADADLSIQTFLEGKEPVDGQRGVTRRVEADVMGWFLPKEKSKERAKL
jgi:salicylate hydroxylase